MSGAGGPDLAALLEEKQRLQRRLQAKQQQSMAAREAGFNTYINSSANEERIADQHRREKVAAAAKRGLVHAHHQRQS